MQEGKERKIRIVGGHETMTSDVGSKRRGTSTVATNFSLPQDTTPI